MQRTPQRCPRCSRPLGMSWDMWGQYYLCQDCGFTAEDDEELTPQVGSVSLRPPAFLTTTAHPFGLRPSIYRR